MVKDNEKNSRFSNQSPFKGFQPLEGESAKKTCLLAGLRYLLNLPAEAAAQAGLILSARNNLREILQKSAGRQIRVVRDLERGNTHRPHRGTIT